MAQLGAAGGRQTSPPFVTRASRCRCNGVRGPQDGAGAVRGGVAAPTLWIPRHSAQIGGRSRRAV